MVHVFEMHPQEVLDGIRIDSQWSFGGTYLRFWEYLLAQYIVNLHCISNWVTVEVIVYFWECYVEQEIGEVGFIIILCDVVWCSSW